MAVGWKLNKLVEGYDAVNVTEKGQMFELSVKVKVGAGGRD